MNGLAYVESEQEKVQEIINKFEEVLVNDQNQFTSENLEKFNLIKDNLNKTIEEMAQDWKYLLYTNDKEYKKRVVDEKNKNNENKLNDLVRNLNDLDYNDTASINKMIDDVVDGIESENLLNAMETQLSSVGDFEDLKCEINAQALFSLDDSSILDSYNESLENISKNSGFNANIITRVEALKTKMSSLYETRHGANKEEQQKLLNQEIYDSYLKQNVIKKEMLINSKNYLATRKRGISPSDKNMLDNCENYLTNLMKQEEENLYKELFPTVNKYINNNSKNTPVNRYGIEKLFEPIVGLNKENAESYSIKIEKLFVSLNSELLFNNLDKLISNASEFEDLEKEINKKSVFKLNSETIVKMFNNQFEEIKKNNYHISGIDQKTNEIFAKVEMLYNNYTNKQSLQNSEVETVDVIKPEIEVEAVDVIKPEIEVKDDVEDIFTHALNNSEIEIENIDNNNLPLNTPEVAEVVEPEADVKKDEFEDIFTHALNNSEIEIEPNHNENSNTNVKEVNNKVSKGAWDNGSIFVDESRMKYGRVISDKAVYIEKEENQKESIVSRINKCRKAGLLIAKRVLNGEAGTIIVNGFHAITFSKFKKDENPDNKITTSKSR